MIIYVVFNLSSFCSSFLLRLGQEYVLEDFGGGYKLSLISGF